MTERAESRLSDENDTFNCIEENYSNMHFYFIFLFHLQYKIKLKQ